MRSRLLIGGLAVLVTAGCGTTVPITSTVAGGPAGSTGGVGTTGTGSGGLGTGSTGSVVGGTSGATTGAIGTTGGAGSTGAGSTGSTGTGEVLPPPPSGSRVTSPMKVGVLVTELGAAVAALGASSGTSHQADDGYKAIIKAINAFGGLAGRKLEPMYEVVDATDSSYQSDADQICAAYKDAHVEMVISDSASTDYGFAGCLAQAQIPMITSVPSDQQGLAKALGVFNAFNPSFDRGYGAVVDQLVASGYVTTKSKIGVIRITCGEISRSYDNTVLPRMKAHHLATPIEYTVQCANGFQDAGAYSAAMQSAVLRFRASGVDRVFINGSQENLLLQYFAEQAQSQAYHPGYALSSSSFPVTLIDANTFPQQQLPQVHGVGWHPLGDTGVESPLAQEKRCVSLSKAGGLAPANITERFALYQACSNLFLLEASLKRGDGRATGAELRSTILSLGTSFPSTGIVGGATFFAQGRQDGVQLANEWGFVSSCTCFRYVGKPAVMR